MDSKGTFMPFPSVYFLFVCDHDIPPQHTHTLSLSFNQTNVICLTRANCDEDP